MTVYTPDPIVEVALDYGPYDEVDPGDWVDISSDVLEVQVQRGRNSEFDAFPASTATVRLNNDDRRYDPLNLAGPHVHLTSTGTPYIVSQNTKTGTSLGTSNAMNMPSGVVAGDLLIAIISQNPISTAMTASAGWTQIVQTLATSLPGVGTAVFAKIAAGSDTLSITGEAQDFACLTLRIAGHGVTNVSQILKIMAKNAPASTLPTPPLTGLNAENRYLVLDFAGCNDDNETYPWWTVLVTGPVEILESAQSASSTMLMVSQGVTSSTDHLGSIYFFTSADVLSIVGTLAIPGTTSATTRLKPNVPIRIRADMGGGVKVPVWYGVVDGWPGTYSEGGYRNEVEVPCTDVFKVLAERPMPDTLQVDVDAYALARRPYAWFRGDKDLKGRLVNRQGRTKSGIFTTPVDIGEGLTPVSQKSLKFPAASQTNPGVQFPIVTGGIINSSPNDDMLSSTKWSWSALFQAEGAGTAGSIIRLVSTISYSNVVYTAVNVSDTGLFWASTNGVGATLTASPFPLLSNTDIADNLYDGNTHHLVAVRDVTTLSLYVDGRLVTSTTNALATGSFNFSNFAVTYVGRASGGAPGFSMGEVMFFPQVALSASEVTALYQSLTVGFGTRRATGEAIEDALDAVGWPAALRAIDGGEVIIDPPANPREMSALELLQKIAETEQGRLFIDAEGNVVFHSRDRFLTQTTENTVQYTFSDDGVGVGTLDETLQITVDDKFLYDGAKVNRVGGIEQSATFGTGVPIRTRTLDDLYFIDDSQSLNLAESIVFLYGVAGPRSETWQVDGEVEPSDWPDILALEIGHRIKHELAPGGGGSAIDLEQHVEWIEHDITPERWLITMNGSPVDDTEYFLWDTTTTTDNQHGWDRGVWG